MYGVEEHEMRAVSADAFVDSINIAFAYPVLSCLLIPFKEHVENGRSM